MPNRLAQETSPYLLQHQHNPVDWYPWGEEALEKARREQKPIFLSIGYSACHWCHVMEHESFEDPELAQLLNEHFVPIKVDREERPDLDHIYMTAVQALTGRGGWPMSVFLTPDLEPFHGGTYWPPRARMGMPGFDQVLRAVADVWANRRDDAISFARDLTQRLKRLETIGGDTPLRVELLHHAARSLERLFDHQHGGFGGAPKFPHPMDLQVLLRVWKRDPQPGVLHMVTHTLDCMASGGIYDHLAGGFHRYAVDDRWLVPHFEKMLYDNALLTVCYLEAFQATGKPEYARVARETLDFLLADMTDPQGGLHSTLDADSEGEEGKYYVWTPAELREVLGAEAAERFAAVYDVSDLGNWEGKNILHLPRSVATVARLRGWDAEELENELAESRGKLLQARRGRVAPGRDDKVLVSWNALAIEALARAAGVLEQPRFLLAAQRAAEFLWTLRREDGRLLHSWRDGRARFDAYLDDYAYLINALVTLYEADFDTRWIRRAVTLADTLLEHFYDARGGGFFYTADDHQPLIARPKDVQDSSVPSGNGMAALALLRLGKLTGRGAYLEAAGHTLRALAELAEHAPTGAGQLLVALDFHLGPAPELVGLGKATLPWLAALRRRFVPNKVLAWRADAEPAGDDDPLAELFAGREAPEGEPVVFRCENFVCQAPAIGAQAIGRLWDELAQPAGDNAPQH